MKLRRYHGLGNDYLVLESAEALRPHLVEELCDRHTGVGGDGVLEPLRIRREPESGRPVSAYALRIWNPDGSIAEKSGNGLRIFAAWLARHRAAPPRFTIEVRLSDDTPGELVACEVHPALHGHTDVTVQMGKARFEPGDIPCTERLDDTCVDVGGAALRLTAVGTGNPHCVVFLDDPLALDTAPWRAWGAALERHPLFPNRTNVQVAALQPDDAADVPVLTRIDARIWERGAGETRASGSSSCAIAAAAVRRGLAAFTDGVARVEVCMPGGSLRVDVAEDWGLTLRGPVEEIGRVQVAPEWLDARRAPAG